MNVDDMTDEEFIDYCRNGGELSGLITERHPKCDWCGGMKDGRFIDADPLIILKADNHQGSDRWDVYVSKTVYPTAESYGTLAGVLRMLADDVEIMAREKEMGGGQ